MAEETAQTSATVEEEGGTPEAAFLHGNRWQPTAMWGITFSVMVVLATFGLAAKKKVPGALQNAWEFLYEWLDDNCRQVVGEEGMAYFPLYMSIFVYVFFNNLLGLFPYLASATASSSTTLAMGIITALSTHALGFRKKGFGHILHYFQVVDFREGDNLMAKAILFVLQFLLLPVIEIIGAVAQPISLAARLFGNVFAKETILASLAALLVTLLSSHAASDKALAILPLALRPAIIILGVLVSLIQAIVFTILSMVYISNATASHHAEGHEEHGAHEAPAH